MSEPILGESLRNELKELIREVIREELSAMNGRERVIEADPLLTPAKAADLIGVNVQWLYRHAGTLPFTRRISRRNLGFSEAGLRRWIAAKKPDFRR